MISNLQAILSATLILFVLFGCSENIRAPHSLSQNHNSPNDILEAPIDESSKTQILVLATPHLRSLGKGFYPSILDSLLFVLEKFRPDLISVESMPSSLIEDMQRKKGHYSEVLNQFAKDRIEYGQQAQKLLGVSTKEAEQTADSLLQVLTKQMKNEYLLTRRLNLVMWMLASYDLNSALLQWSYLPENSRTNTEIVTEDVATFLNEQLKQPNEISSIGIVLAKTIGLQRIESIDDHKDKDIFMTIAPNLMNELKDNPMYKSVANSLLYVNSESRLQEAVQEGNLLPYYLYINSSEYTSKDVKTQWHLFFRTNLPSGLDRSRVALWEVRNLNIASHIRRVTVLHPGKRMLVIIGASHKPFLDSYLSQMMDVRLVHLEDVLVSK